jgi:hypothetical protein
MANLKTENVIWKNNNGVQITNKKRGKHQTPYSRGNIKIMNMKKFAFLPGAISISLSSLGLLFKMNHWHPADFLMVVGIWIFSLLFTPSIFKYIYDRV